MQRNYWALTRRAQQIGNRRECNAKNILEVILCIKVPLKFCIVHLSFFFLFYSRFCWLVAAGDLRHWQSNEYARVHSCSCHHLLLLRAMFGPSQIEISQRKMSNECTASAVTCAPTTHRIALSQYLFIYVFFLSISFLLLLIFWLQRVYVIFLFLSLYQTKVCVRFTTFPKRLQNCTSKWYIRRDDWVSQCCTACVAQVYRKRPGNMWMECVFGAVWESFSIFFSVSVWENRCQAVGNLSSWHYYLWNWTKATHWFYFVCVFFSISVQRWTGKPANGQ